MNTTYFCHSSTGKLVFDHLKGHRKFEPWWALVIVDQGIIDYYSWMFLKWGIPLQKGSLWGPHISVIKGQEPINKELWGVDNNKIVDFHYSNVIRYDNDQHAWLDVYSEEIDALRVKLGYQSKMTFHLTLGRLD